METNEGKITWTTLHIYEKKQSLLGMAAQDLLPCDLTPSPLKSSGYKRS